MTQALVDLIIKSDFAFDAINLFNFSLYFSSFTNNA